MKVEKEKILKIISEEIDNFLYEASWLDNLDLAAPTAMISQDVKPRAKTSKEDRYPNLGHAVEAIRIFFSELVLLRDDTQALLGSQPGLFRKEGSAAVMLKVIADINSVLQNEDYKAKLKDLGMKDEDVLREYYNQLWDDVLNSFMGIKEDIKILFHAGSDSIENIFPKRIDRIEEMLNFILKISNARLSSVRVGFDLDPAGIRALGQIPPGISYEKPEVQ